MCHAFDLPRAGASDAEPGEHTRRLITLTTCEDFSFKVG